MRPFHLPFGLALVLAACSSSSSSGPPGGGNGGSSSSGGTGIDGGTGTDSGASSSGTSGAAGSLPKTTFLFTRKTSATTDSLIAYDVATGQSRVVTDLKSDGSSGWDLWGVSISPDRTRIAIASNYGPTKEDVDTKIATRRVWTLAPDGTDFKRMTPVFSNTGGGKTNFNIDIARPAFSKDGTRLLYQYGEYWYEGTSLKGGTNLWSVGSQGGTVPVNFAQPLCSVIRPAVDPKTGSVLVKHSVCVPPARDGLYLYPANGGDPTLVLEDGELAAWLETPSWAGDGSGFAFIGRKEVPFNGTTRTAQGVFTYEMATKEILQVVLPEAENESVRSVAVAPDISSIVYCLAVGDANNLHRIDLTVTPATDAAITNDGVSCDPVW
jgi:hypothetical protein